MDKISSTPPPSRRSEGVSKRLIPNPFSGAATVTTTTTTKFDAKGNQLSVKEEHKSSANAKAVKLGLKPPTLPPPPTTGGISAIVSPTPQGVSAPFPQAGLQNPAPPVGGSPGAESAYPYGKHFISCSMRYVLNYIY